MVMEGALLLLSNKCQLSEMDFLVHKLRLAIPPERFLFVVLVGNRPALSLSFFRNKFFWNGLQTPSNYLKLQRLFLLNYRGRNQFCLCKKKKQDAAVEGNGNRHYGSFFTELLFTKDLNKF